MPRKKKRLFTKQNSTKFLLYTDGRDAEGNKIKENVLVPVSRNHVPGSSLLLSNIAGLCSLPNGRKAESEVIERNVSQYTNRKVKSKSDCDKEPDLENILEQMDDTSGDEEDDNEEYETTRSRLENMGFFIVPKRHPHSNVHVEVYEDCSDFSDEFGQFSDADSNIGSNEFHPHYSYTSFKADCPENLKILNEGFEKVLEDYDENQIGALDDEEICGMFSTENEQIQNFMSPSIEKEEKEIKIGDCDEDLKEKILEYCERDEPEKIVEIIIEKPLEFDCESILSTYSNKYNHPVLIKEEGKVKKITIPNNPMQKKLTKSKLKQLEPVSESDDECDKMSVATSFNIRMKDETPDQKRERKTLFKELKKERRQLKKENKVAFKNEKIRQIAQNMNSCNNAGIKLV